MDDNSDPPALTLGGHSPVFSKKRKTNTRQKKISLYTTATNAGGVPKLESMFAPSNAQPPQSTQLPLRFGHIAVPDETQEKVQGASEQLKGEKGNKASGAKGGAEDAHSSEDGAEKVEENLPGSGQGADQGTKEEEVIPTWEYSNEARVYHCKYSELAEAYLNHAYDYCRDGCLDLLLEPNLPQGTRIQTLHLVSTLVHSDRALSFLQDAEAVLNELDQEKWQVRLLKQDNVQMVKDLEMWRLQEPLGQGVEGDDDMPSHQWVEFNRKYQEMVKQELEEELEGVTAVEEPAVELVGHEALEGVTIEALSAVVEEDVTEVKSEVEAMGSV
ncbi:hypothetical protein LTR97_002238 [Elasticomyces elasticus]|uniref:Uncharacterized protein n=1 Tax=Elasticomyces elasticus TaxID=574655 RepID=A0AAN7WBA5_9PEZI|nr:hypothetical protein LTR97_002238 [Elasticomyces elasticus]